MRQGLRRAGRRAGRRAAGRAEAVDREPGSAVDGETRGQAGRDAPAPVGVEISRRPASATTMTAAGITAATASGATDRLRLADLLAAASPRLDPAPTTSDDVAFWLYTSGSTGTPKGSMHLHRDLITTAVHYGVGTLGIRGDDLVYSAAKLFFAYGLGNGMTFPFHVRRDGGSPRRPARRRTR